MRVTIERLRELVVYDPETGKFTAILGRKSLRVGQEPGYFRNGYRIMRIDNRYHGAHRLAFLWMTGRWPKKHIDHINRNPSDNRWVNLREATARQNAINRPTKNKLPYRGVRIEYYQCKDGSRFLSGYTARIRDQFGKQHRIGVEPSAVLAALLYDKAARELHKEFAQLNFPKLMEAQ